MTRRNFSLQKENDYIFQLCFVKCCTFVTEGYHELLSLLNRLVRSHFIMVRVYIIRTSWEHNQRKSKCSELGVLSPSEGDLGGRVSLRKFLGPKEYLDWFNNTGKTLSYSIQCKNLLKYKLGCSWPFYYVYTINFYILYCHIIKECRCLKNANHQLERNEWLLISAFQQGLQQKIVFVLTQENVFW